MNCIAIYEGFKQRRVLIFLVCQCFTMPVLIKIFLVAVPEFIRNKQTA